MIAFGLSLALFAFWGVLGYVFLAILVKRNNLLQNMLLAPTVGIGVTLLPIFWLNRLGLPVGRFGVALLFVLLLVMVVLLWRVRPVVPLKNYRPFAVALLVALIVTGRPMLEF